VIDAQKLDVVFRDCLFTDEELKVSTTPAPVIVEGVLGSFGFHPTRLESHRNFVRECLAQLPKEFMEESGGGWSFLNACMTKNGKQWGEHFNVNELYVLGQALNFVKCLLPRDMWNILPGGMPYFVVRLNSVH
jgi:hypothetical protein